MNLRQLAYGLLSYVPGIPEAIYRGTGGSSSAEYCYCIWLRHLVLAGQGGMPALPKVVAELGPGDSIGVGLAALLSGAERYLAVDAMAHADPASNLQVFDGLVALFRARAPIPDQIRFPEHIIELDSYVFPSALLPEAQLRAALAPDRVAWLREVVAGVQSAPGVVDYRPTGEGPNAEREFADLVLSNAVLEHVADLRGTYRITAEWLRPGGHASHQIDFRSHGLFHAWDGHWACPDWLWRLFVGKRDYLLNREPLSTHRKLATDCGFEERLLLRHARSPEAVRVAPRFRGMETADRTTDTAYMLLRKTRAAA
ncbi:MAG TPA: hypothetical protein VFG18_06350 [Xanthomonadaceae bacterium]|nr:hypothetical protein [Xanthomonadaceae bacterium]